LTLSLSSYWLDKQDFMNCQVVIMKGDERGKREQEMRGEECEERCVVEPCFPYIENHASRRQLQKFYALKFQSTSYPSGVCTRGVDLCGWHVSTSRNNANGISALRKFKYFALFLCM
jgi:hypothetical protein